MKYAVHKMEHKNHPGGNRKSGLDIIFKPDYPNYPIGLTPEQEGIVDAFVDRMNAELDSADSSGSGF